MSLDIRLTNELDRNDMDWLKSTPLLEILIKNKTIINCNRNDSATIDTDQMRQWLHENTSGKWYFNTTAYVSSLNESHIVYIMYFENTSDMVAFKLRWS